MKQKIKYACMCRRLGAFLIDTAVVLFGLLLFSFLIPQETLARLYAPAIELTSDLQNYRFNFPNGLKIYLMILFLQMILNYMYSVYMTAKWGQTIGKWLFKIKVVDARTGNLTSMPQVFVRETFGKFLSGLIFGMGYLYGYLNPKSQMLHDVVAGTVVIKN